MKLSDFDKIVIGVSILVFVISILLIYFFDEYGLFLSLLLLALIVLKFQNRNKNIIYNEIRGFDQIYSQLDSLISIHNTLNINKPLPTLRGYAASPDFLKHLLEILIKNNPKTIVELGSGSSSIITGYYLKQHGSGALISLDDSKKYRDITQESLIFHQVDDLVTVHHTPLKIYEISNREWEWYDISKIDFPKIDILIVDGPPNTSFMARFPAIPLLNEYFHDETIIILDDAARKSEKMIIQEWMKMGFTNRYDLPTEKGMTILKKY